MNILNSAQIRKADSYTIENEPVASIDLMERASKTCYNWIKRNLKKKKKVNIFCGMGNNGGDGLAVARMLGGTGYDVTVFIIRHTEKSSEDFQINEARLNKVKGVKIKEITEETPLPDIDKDSIIIDAMLGSGLTRPLEGLLASIVQHINETEALVVAIDFPSGLFCEDNSENIDKNIIRANYTLTFQVPKLSFMFPENSKYVGEWHVLDIGLHRDFLDSVETKKHLILEQDLQTFYRRRDKFSHKGNYGHGLLISGSYGKMGAAILAARGALRSGIGLLTVHVPGRGYEILQSSLPEAMCSIDEHDTIFSGIKDIGSFNAIGTGPGLGTEKETEAGLKLLIQNYSAPMVLDADAINILANNPTWFSFLPGGSILTPHVKEFERIAGKCSSTYERMEKALELAFRYQVFIVLKGAHTLIAFPDGRTYFNSTGNPGMATGGTGDVLTGIILGLLAQGYLPSEAAVAGVYLHGLAADISARHKGFEALLASDIIESYYKAVKKTFY